MKKLLQLKTMLLLCALIVGSVSVWAEEETISFFSNSSTTGWTINGNPSYSSTGGYQLVSSAYSIVSPSLTFSGYTTITITIKARKYGGPNATQGQISVSQDETILTTVSPTTTSLIDYGPLTITPSDGTITISCPGASSNKGCGVSEITIKGTLPDGTQTTTTIDASGIKTERKGGAAAGSLTASVKAGEDAVVGATVTWESSDETVATIDSEGAVTLIKAGFTIIKAKYAGDATYVKSEGTYNLTVTDNRDAAGLAFEPNAQTINVDQTHEAFNLTNPHSLTVTYSSSNTGFATVDENTGAVTGIAAGDATITASFAGNDNYKAGEASYTLTVNENEAVDPVGPAGGTGRFVKVTTTDAVTDGDYLIVYEDGSVAFDGSLETLDATSNIINVTISNDEIEESDETKAAVFTWNSTEKTLKSKSGLYIGNSSYGNSLKQNSTATYTNTIEFDESGNVIITAVESKDGNNNNYTTLRFNYAVNQNRFRYYKSGQQAIQLYKYEAGNPTDKFEVTVGDSKWRTLVTSVNATLPPGLTAYIVTANDGNTATLTSIDAIKANTAVLLNGNANDYELTVTEGYVDYGVENQLQISDASTTNGVYVLANKVSHGVGFYKWDGGLLGAGRVYLEVPESAREFISFDAEATGIENVNREVKDFLNGEFFNLNGQRVAQPTKCLYIVTGMKVLIK